MPGTLARSGRAPRVLIYSHDTFGLGHIRRSRAIANALVAANPDMSVIIISGSPVVGSFEFGNGVDFVRVPGVVKLPDGDYTSLNLNLALDEAVALRETVIRNTSETFAPDVFIVDKEPTGFRGEIMPTLEMLRARGTRLVLGVRDVLDEPALLVPEWERKGAVDALERFYDDIWIYGLKELYEPLAALPLSAAALGRISYTGYLRREIPEEQHFSRHPRLTRGPFILVTTGGGGDGAELIDWVVSAYESTRNIPIPALVVFGPFMASDVRRQLSERIAKLDRVDAINFDSKIETLIQKASAVIGMGGYNTFCELLSLDKPALIVPRRAPRAEQAIRAECAERLGLMRQLGGLGDQPPEPHDPEMMAEAIVALSEQPPPSQAFIPGLMDGLDRIQAMTSPWFEAVRQGRGPRTQMGVAAE